MGPPAQGRARDPCRPMPKSLRPALQLTRAHARGPQASRGPGEYRRSPGPSSNAHSSGLEPLKLMRTCGNAECPFSSSSSSNVFSPDASARASRSRERCFSIARFLGSRRWGSIRTRYDLAAFVQMVPRTRRKPREPAVVVGREQAQWRAPIHFRARVRGHVRGALRQLGRYQFGRHQLQRGWAQWRQLQRLWLIERESDGRGSGAIETLGPHNYSGVAPHHFLFNFPSTNSVRPA